MLKHKEIMEMSFDTKIVLTIEDLLKAAFTAGYRYHREVVGESKNPYDIAAKITVEKGWEEYKNIDKTNKQNDGKLRRTTQKSNSKRIRY